MNVPQMDVGRLSNRLSSLSRKSAPFEGQGRTAIQQPSAVDGDPSALNRPRNRWHGLAQATKEPPCARLPFRGLVKLVDEEAGSNVGCVAGHVVSGRACRPGAFVGDSSCPVLRSRARLRATTIASLRTGSPRHTLSSSACALFVAASTNGKWGHSVRDQGWVKVETPFPLIRPWSRRKAEGTSGQIARPVLPQDRLAGR